MRSLRWSIRRQAVGAQRNLLQPALDRLRAGGVRIDVVETSAPNQAAKLARDAYAKAGVDSLLSAAMAPPTKL